MASFIIPERPIPIIGQTTTVDISPGTKYGHKSDGAVITTTMIVENPEPNDLSVPFSLLTADPEGGEAARSERRVLRPSPRVRVTVLGGRESRGQAPTRCVRLPVGASPRALKHENGAVKR